MKIWPSDQIIQQSIKGQRNEGSDPTALKHNEDHFAQ